MASSVTIGKLMSAKVLVLILATSLLGAGSPCRCEGSVPVKARQSPCDHCPKKSAPQPSGCPVSGCCCVQEGSDRAAEDLFSIPPVSVAFAIDLIPAVPALPAATPHVESMELIGDVHRRSHPPLYILFRHFTI